MYSPAAHFLQFARMQPVLQLAPHLVFEPKLVHQPGLARLGRGERPLVDDGPHFLGRFLPSLRDSRHQVSVQVVHHAGHHLAGFRTHVAAGEHVAVVFILAGVLHIDADAELVQRLLEVHHLRPQPLQHQGLLRAEIDAVGSQGHVVVARRRRPQERVDRLAGLAEPLHAGADLLELGPAGGEPFRLQHDGLDMRIGGGFL